jgi:hypothetical protein
MQAVSFYGPRRSCVSANAKPDGECCGDGGRIFRVRANLVNIAVDVYRELPGSSAINGTRNPPT